MNQWIGYGDERIPFAIPEGSGCFELAPQKPIAAAHAREEVVRALSNPFGVRLEDTVKPGSRVCVISDDISRPTPAALILEVLMARLCDLGVREEDVTVVLALGSHRKMTPQEIDRKLGAGVQKKLRVLQSAFTDGNDLVDMGSSESGVHIKVYRGVMESDVRIGIGNIVPHGTLGWSGGAKILFPGVTAESTVAQFHMKAAMLGNSYFGRAENPVRHDIEAWTEKIGLHFIINTILDGNQNICSVVAGHYVQAHRAGVELGKRIYFVKAPQKADIVIVDSHPSDGDFWQGTKGFYPSDILLRDGGTSILVAPCLEGEGPHALYARMIGDDHADEVLEKLYRDGCHDVDPLAAAVGAQLSRMRRRYHMAMYTRGLSDEVLKRAKIRRVYDIGGELAALNKQYGGHAVIAVVRCGAEIVPELE